MFDDIIVKTFRSNDHILTEASEHFKELTDAVFTEAASILASKQKVHGLEDLMEAANEQQKKSLIARLIEGFKTFIGVIIKWFTDRFDSADRRLEILIKRLESKDTKSIIIDAPANISKLEWIHSDIIEKAGNEIREFNAVHILNSFNNKSVAEIAQIVESELSGYVPVLSKYDNYTIDETKAAIFGEMQSQHNLDANMIIREFKSMKSFSTELLKYDKAYSHTLDSMTGKIMLPGSDENMFHPFMHGITKYFHRNITLIAGIAGEFMSIAVQTLTKLDAKAITISK